MGKETTVRVLEGTVLSEKMSANLKDTFLHDFEVEFYKESTDQYRSYTRKRDSFFDAFLLIITAIPAAISPDDINKYLRWCREQCNLPPNLSVHDYEASLSRFTAFLTNALTDYWEFPKEAALTKNPALELLNKAEQYVIMRKGCPDIATLSTLDIHTKGEFILQWDKRLPPCSKETLAELDIIKNNVLTTTPEWFRTLTEYQQTFFHSNDADSNSRSTLKTSLTQLQNRWKGLKSRYSSKLLNDLKTLATGAESPPFWFEELSFSDKAILKSVSPLISSLSDVDVCFRDIGKLIDTMGQDCINELPGLRKLPYWYVYMSEHEQRLLKTTLSEADTVEDAVSFLPSRLRTLPGLANFAEHYLMTLSHEGEVLDKTPPRRRSSHPMSRAMEKQPSQIGELHGSRNLNTICEYAQGKPISIQSLISPLHVTKGHKPDYYLYTQLGNFVKELRKKTDISLYLTNHPFNLAKYLTPTLADDIECNALSIGAQKKLSSSAVAKQVANLDLDQNEQISDMISESIVFTCEYNQTHGFAELLQLMEKNFFSVKGLSLGRFKQMVNVAFLEASLYVKEEADFKSYELFDNSEDLVKKRLIEFFIKHHGLLSQWEEWQSIFANYYYIKSNHDNASLVLNFTSKLCDLAQINSDYKNLLNSAYGTGTFWDYHGRELFLSSLENLQTILKEEMSYGFCVSGKDRKSIELIHTDAMLLYRRHYGRWPNINDSGIARANFVDIVAQLYLTRHAHELADQNAPGAEGIKTPYDYWPKDIAEAICLKAKMGTQTLIIDDILASRNEPEDIGNVGESLEPGLAKCIIAAMRLSEESQLAILTSLKIICEESDYLASLKSYSLPFFAQSPDGLQSIRDTLNASLSMTEAIGRVYHIISRRPETSFWRVTDTQDIYGCMLGLCRAENPENVLDNALQVLGCIKQKAFEYNHAHKTSTAYNINSAVLDAF